MTSRSYPLDSMLIFTSAYFCDDADSAQIRAGYAIIDKRKPREATVHHERGFSSSHDSGEVDGEHPDATLERAELYAAIRALELRWIKEGWIRVTIASSSAKLVYGIANRVLFWQQRD